MGTFPVARMDRGRGLTRGRFVEILENVVRQARFCGEAKSFGRNSMEDM